MTGFLVLFSMAACKKWVDNTPQPLQVDESKVFSTEQGFRETLNGVYLQMGAETLYGKEMTMGVLSLAGRNFDVVNANTATKLHYQAATYNFTALEMTTYTAKLWNKMYATIANLNNLLDNIERRKALFTGQNYNTFKGEVLALRAYLHFDLLRMFSPIEAGAIGIPYVTAVNPGQVQSGTVGNTLDKCIADLTAAEALLSATDLTNIRMTKWGVKGLLARLYLYRSDKVKAAENALAVINSNNFALTVSSNADLFFAKESLFKLQIFANNYFAYFRSIFGAPSLIGLAATSQVAIYGTANTDYRKSFIDVNTGNALGTPILPKKFNATAANSFPMLRLSEQYYILAECANDVATGLNYLNQVRAARNLSAPLTTVNVPDAAALTTEITNEYRKEFIGEGQMFFYYKRKNTAFTALPFALPIAANPSYTFVRPE
ncbi:RagB/SusD family nutrient uptake outer membrane protein [Pedobacter insulae]|nr:RagB/SusD family nutrient uptake outer membrane protein [Pedobacter insulae]